MSARVFGLKVSLKLQKPDIGAARSPVLHNKRKFFHPHVFFLFLNLFDRLFGLHYGAGFCEWACDLNGPGLGKA